MSFQSLQTLVVGLLFAVVVWFVRGWKEDVDKKLSAAQETEKALIDLRASIKAERTNVKHQEQVEAALSNILGLLGGQRLGDIKPQPTVTVPLLDLKDKAKD